MFFYLSHGAMARSAIYYPAIRGCPEETRLVKENSALRLAVQDLPIFLATPTGIPLHKCREFVIENRQPETVRNMSWRLAASELPASLNLRIMCADQTSETLAIPLDATGNPTGEWVEIPNLAAKHWSRIEVTGTTGSCNLSGIRSEKTQTTRWPWDRGLTMRIVFPLRAEPSRPESFRSDFISAELLPENWSGRPIDDRGFTILYKRLPFD